MSPCSGHSPPCARFRITRPSFDIILWLRLSIEYGSICIDVSLLHNKNHTKDDLQQHGPSQHPPVLVFQLACDSHMGQYVTSFLRSNSLIRRLSCNDAITSEVHFLRGAKFADLEASSISARRRNSTRKALTGCTVRDAFKNLNRSVDTLGRRVIVGEDWEDVGRDKITLQEKTVMQSYSDIRKPLMTCVCVSLFWGVTALTIDIAGGVNAIIYMAGGSVTLRNMTPLLVIPSISIVPEQYIVEYTVVNGNVEYETNMRIERELYGVL